MTALTKDRKTVRQEGVTIALPVIEADIIYLGSLVNVNAAGYAKPAANVDGEIFMGHAEEHVDNSAGANGDKEVQIRRRGIVHMAAVGLAIADIGADLYIVDDQTVGTTAGNVRCGKLAYFESATVAPLDMDPLRYAQTPGENYFTVDFSLETIGATPKTIKVFEQPRAFKVLRGYATVQTAPAAEETVTVTITDGTTPKTIVIAAEATSGEAEAINQQYAADADITISAVDLGTTGAGLQGTLICQYV